MNFSGGLFGWGGRGQKIRLENSGPKFGSPKFVSQNSALNCSGGAKSPVQTLVSDNMGYRSDSIAISRDMGPLSLATQAAIYRSFRALRARNRKNVSKRVFLGGLEKSLKKYPKKSKNLPNGKITFLGIFLYFETFSGIF